MFWKKDSEAYTDLENKLFWYIQGFKYEQAGSKEYLPTKSDLDNLSEEELAKFKEKVIYKNIEEEKESLESDERSLDQDVQIHSRRPSTLGSEVISIYKKRIKEKKAELRYYDEFLEALEAGGLREKASDENEDD